MKKVFRTVAMAAVVIAASCGKDDAPSEMQQQAQEQEELAENLEKTPLEANKVSDNVVIEGSTKNEGNPPTPNQMISLDISGTGKTAFLNEGFDIELSSDATIAGAYIQFKANDGTVSDSYYDVDLTTSSQFGKYSISEKAFGLKSKKINSLVSKNEGDVTVDVDFNSNIEPGTFCYVVCVYDAEGNISAPSEVCATVESWGGNADLVAKWDIVKQEYRDGDETDIDIIGEEDCTYGSLTTDCSNGEINTFYNCSTYEFMTLELRADGTFSYRDKAEVKRYDEEASKAACETVYQDMTFVDKYNSDGNWAYVQGESRLTLVETSYSYSENDVIEEEDTYELGEGELIFDGAVEISGDSFTLSEDGSDFFKVYLAK